VKIAVCAMTGSLESPLDPRFGRCACFAVVDTDTREVEAVANPGATLGQGAGIQAAQAVSAKQVAVVIAGNLGPNTHQALAAAGVKVYSGATGTVNNAVDQYLAGSLQEIGGATVPSHFGMGSGGGTGFGGGGRGRGGVGGGGRGMGRGRGRSGQ